MGCPVNVCFLILDVGAAAIHGEDSKCDEVEDDEDEAGREEGRLDGNVGAERG